MTSLVATQPKKAFANVAGQQKVKQKTSPFSIRFTHEERAFLEAQAGNRPLGEFIRALVLCERAEKRRKLRKPQVHDQKIALVLFALGDSRIASNLNQLAKHANVGTLDVSEHVEQELHQSCLAVMTMRNLLIEALGHRA